jgi:NAD(P)-dependent dehydrogenase (short-subunit alcohol dehydrogenase family)
MAPLTADLDLGLAGRTALVTGAGGGMGRAVARLLTEADAHVFGVDHNPEALAAASADWAGEGHGSAALDLGKTADCATAVAAANKLHGRLDIVIAVHALLIRNDIADVDEVEWDRMMAVNARSQFFLAKAALPLMTERKFGRIVLFASPAGFMGSFARASAYAMTKGTSVALARSITRTHAQYGITCNVVSPGSIDTPMLRTGLTDADVGTMAQGIPTRRLGDPQEVAYGAVYLASRWASYVNGHVLVVDGGATMHA